MKTFALNLFFCFAILHTTTAQTIIDQATLNGDNGFTIHAAQPDAFSSRSIAIGDFSNDTKQDLIIGTNTFDDQDKQDVGRLYIIHNKGEYEANFNLGDLGSDEAITFSGTDEFDNVGSATIILDYNGDGIDDIAVAATGEDAFNGACYVIFGGQDFGGRTSFILKDIESYKGLKFIPDGQYGLGWGLTSGDLNNDGLSDLIMGANSKNNWSGAVYVFYGSEVLSGELKVDTLDVTEGFYIDGYKDSEMGTSLASGDINDDGIDDLILGARSAEVAEDIIGGQGYILFGHTQIDTTTFLTAADITGNRGLTFNGTDFALTSQFVTVGDVNNDNIADAIFSAEKASYEQIIGSGGIHIILGGNQLNNIDLIKAEDLDGNLGYSIYGSFEGQHLGSYPVVNDLNSDGIMELVIGASNFSEPELSGELFIIEGSASQLTSPKASFTIADFNDLDILRIEGANPMDNMGRINVIGDVNNDGINDLCTVYIAIDAHERDRGSETYVFYGPLEAKSQEADIVSFLVEGQTNATVFNDSDHTIKLVMPSDADLKSLVPTIAVSDGAIVTPDSGVPQDFTNTVTYIVTAEDGTTNESWEISIELEATLSLTPSVNSISIFPNPANDILTLRDIPANVKRAFIYDVSGNEIASFDVSANKKNDYFIGNINPGFYIIKLDATGPALKLLKR